MFALSKYVKIFLSVLTLITMSVGIAGVWGYAGPDTVGKAIATMAIIGVAVFVIDGVINAKKSD